MTRPKVLRFARNAHLYSGVFLAPAVLFFAITGGLQTFGLHETSRGSTYKPPALLVHLAQWHKKQTIDLPPPRNPATGQPVSPKAATANPAEPAAPLTKRSLPADPQSGKSTTVALTPPAARVHNLWPMKIFFALVSLGLVLSTFSGLYMSFNFIRNKLLLSATLAAGIAVPLLLLLF